MINCLAIDDESLALDLLCDNISKVPFLNLVTSCSSATAAIDTMSREKIDLLFLDIQMPGMTGLQLLKGIYHPPYAIIISAYPNHALEGYELDIVDYLVKPVSFERFLKAADKVKERIELKSATPTKENPHFFVNADYKLIKVLVYDILLVEGLKDYIKIHLASQEKAIITRISMKNMEDKLQPFGFIRVHKSYIVNISKIEAIHKNRILIKAFDIPVSDNHKDSLFKHIDKNIIS